MNILVDKFYSKLIFLCVLSFITMFNRLNYSPIGYDDAFYAQRSKELLYNKDYFFITPTYNYKIRFDNKPPIIYWFLALSGKLFGFENWSMRIFPALFGFVNVLFAFFIVSKFFNDSRFGFFVGFILNFTQQFIYYSRSATPETIFCLFFWLSLFSFIYVEKTKKYKYLLLTGTFIGLAIMTRQLFGFLIYIIYLYYNFHLYFFI
mgnify:CR=1 FL=1